MQKVTLQVTVLLPDTVERSACVRSVKNLVKAALMRDHPAKNVKVIAKHTAASWNNNQDITMATHFYPRYNWLIWYEDGMSDPRYWMHDKWVRATDLSISSCLSLTPKR